MIAFIKDTLVYVTVIVAIICIPAGLGGWGHIFGASHFGSATAPIWATSATSGSLPWS